MQEDPGYSGEVQGHFFVVRGIFTSYTWGWCNVWLTGSRIWSIASLVLCMWWRCAVMEPAVSSTPHSGHGIHFRSITRYDSPTPVHFSAMASSNIPARNAPDWRVIFCDFGTLAARPYLLKRPTMTFILCCSQSDLREPTMSSSS